jgi:hypothetical protein
MDKRYGPTYTSLHQSYEEQRNVHTEKYIVNTGTQGTPKQYNLIVMGAKKILDGYLNGSTSYRIKGVFGRAPSSSRSKKQLHSNFFLPNTPAPKTPDPPNPWI